LRCRERLKSSSQASLETMYPSPALVNAYQAFTPLPSEREKNIIAFVTAKEGSFSDQTKNPVR